jgi:tRNA uridine 5-carboxymethylaminomethyl modification enzyme
VRTLLEEHAGIELVQGTVTAIRVERDRVTGVMLADRRTVGAKSVILTAGTFLRGRIHVGTDIRIPAGRAGDPAAVDIAEQLEALGLKDIADGLTNKRRAGG